MRVEHSMDGAGADVRDDSPTSAPPTAQAAELSRGKRWVRSHPFTTMALTIVPNTFNADHYAQANLTKVLAWKVKPGLLEKAAAKGLELAPARAPAHGRPDRRAQGHAAAAECRLSRADGVAGLGRAEPAEDVHGRQDDRVAQGRRIPTPWSTPAPFRWAPRLRGTTEGRCPRVATATKSICATLPPSWTRTWCSSTPIPSWRTAGRRTYFPR